MTDSNHMRSCGCPACQRRRENRMEALASVLVGLVFIVLMLWLAGCAAPLAPTPIPAAHASYDGAEPTSGILALVEGGAVITPHARDRYNALVLTYGREFAPALVFDQGITARADGSYFLTNEGLQKFALMNAWRRMGREPQTKGSTP